MYDVVCPKALPPFNLEFFLCSVTCTFGVGALAGHVQVAAQVARQVSGEVWKVSGFDGPACQLEQGRRVVGHVLDKSHDQWVATKTELLQVDQAEDLPGEERQEVVMETERQQGVKSVGQRNRNNNKNQCTQLYTQNVQ